MDQIEDGLTKMEEIMWHFKGEYTGGAKAYILNKERKQAKTILTVFLSVGLLASIILAFVLGEGKPARIACIFFISMLSFAVIFGATFFLIAKTKPTCDIRIENDGFQVFTNGKWNSLVFYKITAIETYDDFIAVENSVYLHVALQKDLLVEGDWEQLKSLLKEIEARLDSDEPIYQIGEQSTEYFSATVQEKRIYEQFVGRVSVRAPVGEFHYFATFHLENGELVEYEIDQELYEKIQQGQTGTLVLLNGNFFYFGEGENAE